MTAPFSIDIVPGEAATELRLRRDTEAVVVDGWALTSYPGAEVAERWRLEEKAVGEGDTLMVENAAIARLTSREAARLGLPTATKLHATVEARLPIFSPKCTLTLRWTRATGQNVLGVKRRGAWLQEGDGWRRLPETLFAIAEAVDVHNAAAARCDEAERMRAVRTLLEVLPQAQEAVAAAGVLGTISIVEADALSLSAEGEGDRLCIVPVLHRAGDAATPLLADERGREFAGQFAQFPEARGVYSLGGRTYVTIPPPLRQALAVVRRIADELPASRRAFLRAPRAAIAAAIGDETDATLIEGLVLETPEWSERVIGLGLWQARVLPWIELPGNNWFGDGGVAKPAPSQRGLVVGDQKVPLTRAQAEDLAHSIGDAMARGAASVPFETETGIIQVPATEAVLSHLAPLRQPRPPAPPRSEVEVLVIKPNEQTHDHEAMVHARSALPPAEPASLATLLKPHQRDGLRWLQDSYLSGAPGVLLADDMGLGKTLQGLAFLAWVRDGMMAGKIAPAPLLIVAPTGLLANWLAEHDRHLHPAGLGKPLLAFGKGLAALRRMGPDGLPSIDIGALRAANWVLTTYETLRDYDRDFGQVAFAAMLLDEAQKVKTPGIRLTDAAKGMNADFRIAMTGTPVENRLADLWCIVDGIAPGHLQTLHWFSKEYETDLNETKLTKLKEALDQPVAGRPPLLKRRMRADHLPDLPTSDVEVVRAEMRGAQLVAYEETIDALRGSDEPGGVMAALHRLRAVSLHPDPDSADSDAALIDGSVRLGTALGTLDRIAAQRERALIFVRDQAMMARLVPLLQRRYRLPMPPMTISGAVPGAARQLRVDIFQAETGRFDVMLLSPLAGGVGLTLTAANHVIHLERWWNPAVEDQCNGRALRIGQTRPVRIYLPLATLPGRRPSFDENLHELLDRKRRLMVAALMPPEASDNEKADLLRKTLG